MKKIKLRIKFNKKKIFSLAAVILSVLTLFLYNWFQHPKLKYEGEIKISGLKNSVDVYFDQWAVPHVFAKNSKDLFYAAGYLAARERLFQMSMVALAVRGELASVLGKEFLKNDIYFRTWRINETAKKLSQNLSDSTIEILLMFCAGINARIEEIKRDPPIEFKILGFDPPYWDPAVVTGYARMMAWELQSSWEQEVLYGAIISYFGKDKLEEIIPGYDRQKPTIATENFKMFKPIFDVVLDYEKFSRQIFGQPSSDFGSNSWVVSGSKTKTGKPILANDPHLAFRQPTRWYEMHLKGGMFNTSGLCIAGIPVPILGQTERCAWGFTNVMTDDLDFFIEKVNPKNPNQYLSDKKWKQMSRKAETIKIKGEQDTTIIIRETAHGPIISDLHPLLKNKSSVMSLKWTGHWETNEMDAFINLNSMKNWEDFTKALKNFGVPGQNVVYADIDGNIGWRPAVYVPVRRNADSFVPRDGTISLNDWKGRVPFDEMPYLFNPSKGYIATANNKIIGKKFPYYISNLWADPSRADQIVYRLDTMKNITMDDMKSIQLDQTSKFAIETLPHVLMTEIGNEEGNLKKAYRFLRNWDGVESVDSEATLVFHSIIRNLVIGIYGDELSLLGQNYIDSFMGLKYLHSRNIREILKTRTSSWIDNIYTKEKYETISDILRDAVINGVKDIEEKYGPNTSNWKWGDAHSLTHRHLLSKILILEKLFSLNVGPFRSGGSAKSPNAGGYSYTDPFKQKAGASMRRIVDLSNMNETQCIIPTGQSGLPSSPHYRDQAEMFHSGLYRTTRFNEKYIRSSTEFKHLILSPEQ